MNFIHSHADNTRMAHGKRPTTRADEERRDCLREMSAGPIRKPPGRIDRPGHSHQRRPGAPHIHSQAGRGQLGGGAIEVGNAAHSPTPAYTVADAAKPTRDSARTRTLRNTTPHSTARPTQPS